MARSGSVLREAAAAYSGLVEEDGAEATERLEHLILDHQPIGREDAAVMLEFVGYNLVAGGRSDGRDLRAIGRIVEWLRHDG